jgi:hypothetical protein
MSMTFALPNRTHAGVPLSVAAFSAWARLARALRRFGGTAGEAIRWGTCKEQPGNCVAASAGLSRRSARRQQSSARVDKFARWRPSTHAGIGHVSTCGRKPIRSRRAWP